MVGINDINPFAKFDIGIGAIGNALMLFLIVCVIFGLFGWLLYWRITSKQYRYLRLLYKSINGINYLQSTYRARSIPISKAGDNLWFVKGIKRYIAPATKTDAPNRFPHEEREDGEWINFELSTVNEAQTLAGVKFIHQDMRTQRVATGQILEQRLINKGFWEKYKDMIIHVIFYLITMICMVVIFWQWGGITEQISALVSQLGNLIKEINSLECVGGKTVGIVPAIAFLMFGRRK